MPNCVSVVCAVLIAASLSGFARGEVGEELERLVEKANYAELEGRLEQLDASMIERVDLLRWRATMAGLKGENDKAKSLLDQALELDPDNHDVRLERATMNLQTIDDAGALGKLGIAKDARDTFIGVLEEDPDNVDAMVALIQYDWNAPWIAGGRDKRAERNLARLEQLSPGDALSLKVIRALSGEDLEGALALSDRLLDEAPTRSRRLRHGILLQRADRPQDALAHFRAMTTDYPWDPGSWYQLGRTTVLSEIELATGEEAFRKVLELPEWSDTPHHAAALWRLGMNLELQERRDEARDAYRRALELNPEFEPARESLEALDEKTAG